MDARYTGGPNSQGDLTHPRRVYKVTPPWRLR